MSDWSSVQIAEQNHHLHQQPQPQPQQTQYHLNVLPQEFQQILAPRNLAATATTPASSVHFLGEISREPMSPPQPPHFLNYFNKRNDSSSPVGGPGSASFKHLFCAPTISDRGGECNDDQQQDDLWSSEEARKLIKLRRELDSAFRDFPNPQSHLWDEISRMFGAMGCLKSPKNCKEKFERMTQYYKKVREPNGKLPGTEQFFGELEAFYGSNSGLTMCGGEVQKDGNAGDDNLASPEQEQQQQQQQNHQQHQQLNYHVNSSSESAAEYDDPSEEKHLDLKKRKRKSKAARMASMENFVRRFIDRQEEMQKNFLELLEKREQERVKREEAWREQLVTSLTREYDLRAEDHARRMSFDGVIAAALQKATGTEVEIPQGPLPSPYFSNLDESNQEKHHHQQQHHHHHHHQHQEQEQQLQNHHGCDSANKRWLKDEVLVLIQLRAAMEPKFQEVGPKGPFWEEISVGLAARGYKRWSAKRCKEKWENINKYFRKTSNKRRPENTKTCPYFRELDVLYQKGIIGGVRSLPSNISNNNINNNNSSRIEETTDELDRDDSSHADAEVLSIMPTSCDQAATPSNNNPTAVLFSSPEINCAQNTESCRIQKNSSSSRGSQKRSWGDQLQGGGGGNGSLALSFDALQGAELLYGNSNKTLKFDELLAQQQQQQSLMSERQSQEFQEAESSAPSRGCNLVDGFGIRSLGERR